MSENTRKNELIRDNESLQRTGHEGVEDIEKCYPITERELIEYKEDKKERDIFFGGDSLNSDEEPSDIDQKSIKSPLKHIPSIEDLMKVKMEKLDNLSLIPQRKYTI